MANSLNLAQIIGNLGRDPEMRYTPGGQAVTQFNVATSRSWKAQGSEEWTEETEWHRIVVWGREAEQAAERLRKGSKVYVSGRLQTRQWEGKDGQKRYTTELVAERVVFLEKREGGASNAQVDAHVDQQAAAGQHGTRSEPDGAPGPSDADLDDLPF